MMARLTTVVVLVGLLASTGGVSAASAPRRAGAHAATVPAMIVRDVAPLTVGQTQHAAFPGLARMPNGEVHLVWRQGSDHYASRDGQIWRAVSRDGGRTYTDAMLLRTGGDHRDPSISVARGAGFLTWFAGTATNPGAGAYAMREWGPTVRIDTGLSRAAITAPIIELPNGELGAVFYGRKNGDTRDTSWMAWSGDDGRTWTQNRITNQIGAGRDTNEPYAVVDGTDVHVFYRWGSNSGIGMRTTSGSGHTGWAPERQILSNATGRPTVLRTSSGLLVMVYRDVASRSAELAWSGDHGQTWAQGLLLLDSPVGSPNGMTYAAMLEPEPGVIRGVVGMEKQDGSSSLYGFELDPS